MEYVQKTLHHAKSKQQAWKRQAEEDHDVRVAPEGITVVRRRGRPIGNRLGRPFAHQNQRRLRRMLASLRFGRSRWELRIVLHHRPLSINAAASSGSINS